MQNDYISRDMLCTEFENAGWYDNDDRDFIAEKLLESVPSANVKPVVHGDWIINTDDFTPKKRCSVCGYNKPIIAGENVNQEPDTYCANCGSLMNEDN